MERITLIVPALNEKDNIFPFFDRCAEVEKENNTAFRYIFIDDGSTDGTFEEIKRLKALHPDRGITGLSFSRNFGKESAMYAGLKECSTDLAVIIDADLHLCQGLSLALGRAWDTGICCPGVPPIRQRLSPIPYHQKEGEFTYT